MKLFAVIFLLAAVVLAPIHNHFIIDDQKNKPFIARFRMASFGLQTRAKDDDDKNNLDLSYLWAYLAFTYLFSGIVVYFLTKETQTVIKVRQDYLGSQSTITDRTIRLSGIPTSLRSEKKITEFLENLEIGKVESVTICRDWKALDDLMYKRVYLLRKLEEAWAVHLGRSQTKKIALNTQASSSADLSEEAETTEGNSLLGSSHVTPYEKPRPTTRLWYGFLGLQNRKVDAIDYYEERLRKLDDQIIAARKKEYTPTPIAFVTMDSIPACQMAVQALLDPSPKQLLAKLAPAPSDIVWANTYIPRSRRMIRQWTVTIFIVVLTIIWFIPVVPLAGLLDLCSIKQVWPQLAVFLTRHDILKALVQTGLPTLIVSLLNIAVPFLYDYLSNFQGMISQGDVELSVISKNFFFTFFNVFLVFTVFGTASKFWPVLQESFKDNTRIAYELARSVQGLTVFYTNFILLQGVGLLPFRLLEFGSVALYPIMRMGAKTPRDYAELVQPPIFSYGFYLPSAILVFILSLVYSILPNGYQALFFGLIYFVFGYYTYKYQLLYAMENSQHSTGRAWSMICYRVMIGLGTFQVVMAGVLALKSYLVAAGLVIPLIMSTVWYSYFFGRTYEPLMKYIALRSIQRDSITLIAANTGDSTAERPTRPRRESRTVDEDREKGLIFINPSLIAP